MKQATEGGVYKHLFYCYIGCLYILIDISHHSRYTSIIHTNIQNCDSDKLKNEYNKEKS